MIERLESADADSTQPIDILVEQEGYAGEGFWIGVFEAPTHRRPESEQWTFIESNSGQSDTETEQTKNEHRLPFNAAPVHNIR